MRSRRTEERRPRAAQDDDVKDTETDMKEQQDKKRKQWEEDGRVREVSRQSPGIDRGDSKLLRTVREERAVAAPFVPHLCYYQYEPARQLFVLRIACCEKFGSAKKLEGWDIRISFEY